MSKVKIVLIIIAALIVFVLAIQVINASKYKMVVNVVEGENVAGVNVTTERLDFGDLSRNNGAKRFVSLKNEGRISTYIMVWKFGELSELVNIDRNFFTLEPRLEEETKISFEVNIPPSAETRKYEGRVWVFRIPLLWTIF